ncbi:MAG: hypothetical protein Ct9H300mP19_15620 [Dehalococcoidia bacterium]|nr:MAG: hypothetical protein Ct9H300mP19_15620 [Dehalococcoidia bacterium]
MTEAVCKEFARDGLIDVVILDSVGHLLKLSRQILLRRPLLHMA